MQNSLETYLKSKAERDRIRDQLQALGGKLANVGNALMRKPERFSFSNTGVALPAEVTLGRDTFSMNADEWKTAREIQDMIKAFHDADQTVSRTWSEIPQDLRSGLQAPDAFADVQRTSPDQRPSLAQSRRGQWSR
jgi:hypothetical protein